MPHAWPRFEHFQSVGTNRALYAASDFPSDRSVVCSRLPKGKTKLVAFLPPERERSSCASPFTLPPLATVLRLVLNIGHRPGWLVERQLLLLRWPKELATAVFAPPSPLSPFHRMGTGTPGGQMEGCTREGHYYRS